MFVQRTILDNLHTFNGSNCNKVIPVEDTCLVRFCFQDKKFTFKYGFSRWFDLGFWFCLSSSQTDFLNEGKLRSLMTKVKVTRKNMHF